MNRIAKPGVAAVVSPTVLAVDCMYMAGHAQGASRYDSLMLKLHNPKPTIAAKVLTVGVPTTDMFGSIFLYQQMSLEPARLG